MSPDSTFYTKSKTATADTPFQIDDDAKVVLQSINIHCYTNNAYYGTQSFQSGVIAANAVVWFDKPVRIKDLWFKNYAAGSNTTITITGTLI